MSALTDAIKESVDIVSVAQEYVSLKRSGSNFTGLSPFKSEKTPSFVVSPQKQIFKCFSSGIGGNVITLVMEIERVDFMDAIRLLAERGGVNLDDFLERRGGREAYEETKTMREKIKRMHLLTQKHYVKALGDNNEVMIYLTQKRHLTPQYIAFFGLGYAPDIYDSAVGVLRDKHFDPDDMQEAGLAKRSEKTAQLYDFFRHRLTIPLYDPLGNIVGFGARALRDDQKGKYINTPQTPLYDKSKYLYGLNWVKQSIKDYPFVIVVEGYMDVIAAHRAGFPTAVAPCGTSLTKHHVDLIVRYTETVYFLFDSDSAGIGASIRALQTAYERQLSPKMLTLPEPYKDLDEMVNDNENAGVLLQEMMDNAQDGLTWMRDVLSREHDKESVSGREQMINKLFDIIGAMQNVTMQTFGLQRLAQQLGMQYEYLVPQYTSYTKKTKRNVRRHVQQSSGSTHYKPDKKDLTAILLNQGFADGELGDDEGWRLMKGLLGDRLSEEDAVDESLQLWREDQRKDLESAREKSQRIFVILKDYLHGVMKEKLKLAQGEEKQTVMRLMQDIVKYYSG